MSRSAEEHAGLLLAALSCGASARDSGPAVPEPRAVTCNGCQGAVTLRAAEPARLLAALQTFLEEHRACSFHISLVALPRPRDGDDAGG